ncbi:hypothetical protein PU560_03850, partial [Georgenia sp. 10Sc9-8]|nr:hypothetical protein [Georgenia halotolerans]
RAGLAGTALEPPEAAVVLGILFFYGGPLLTLALAVESWVRDRRQFVLAPQTAMGVLWLLLMAAQPFPEWLLASGIYASYDTHPGTGLVRSVLVALAAAVLLLAPWGPPRATPREPVTAPGTSSRGAGTWSR